MENVRPVIVAWVWLGVRWKVEVGVIGGLVKYWKESGISLVPPVEPVAVRRQLEATGREVSEDDSEHDPRLLYFGDYLIGSHLHAFQFETPARSSVLVAYSVDGEEPRVVANSLRDWVALYLTNPDRAVMGPALPR